MAVLDQCLHMIITMFRVIHKLACSAVEQISSRYGDQEQTLRPRVYYAKHRLRVNSIHRNCVGSGGIGGTGSACRGRWTFRRSLCCTRCSCSACIAVMICSCCAMKSEVLGLWSHVEASIVKTDKEELAPHPKNAHDSLPI
jgi:hypothetical protein